MNRRKEIKKYLYSAFLSEFGKELRVYDTRRTPLEACELPCLIYSIAHEESELFSESNQEAKKKADLTVELIMPDCVELMWCMDDTTARIEQLFAMDRFLGDLVSSVHLKSTDIGVNLEGEEILGFAKMNFDLNYYAAPVATPDYLRISSFKRSVLHIGKYAHTLQ